MSGVIGILAVQGDFADHRRALQAFGLPTRLVRRPEHLEDLTGLVLPGGESTTMLKLLDLQGLTGPLLEVLRSGVPVLATCAGMILLAREVTQPGQASFGLLDISVCRNGYGRQVHSGTFALEAPAGAAPLPADAQGVFIRAPRITAVGPGVEVLACRGEDPVLVRQGPVLAACFHPEMEAGHFVTRRFVEMVRVVSACRPSRSSAPSRSSPAAETQRT